MSDEPIVETPVVQNGELIVRCDHTECERTTRVGTDIDGIESSDDGERWRLSFVPTDDGRLEVDGAECPEHRIDAAIDELADEQIRFAKEFAETTDVANKLAP